MRSVGDYVLQFRAYDSTVTAIHCLLPFTTIPFTTLFIALPFIPHLPLLLLPRYHTHRDLPCDVLPFDCCSALPLVPGTLRTFLPLPPPLLLAAPACPPAAPLPSRYYALRLILPPLIYFRDCDFILPFCGACVYDSTPILFLPPVFAVIRLMRSFADVTPIYSYLVPFTLPLPHPAVCSSTTAPTALSIVGAFCCASLPFSTCRYSYRCYYVYLPLRFHYLTFCSTCRLRSLLTRFRFVDCLVVVTTLFIC